MSLFFMVSSLDTFPMICHMIGVAIKIMKDAPFTPFSKLRKHVCLPQKQKMLLALIDLVKV